MYLLHIVLTLCFGLAQFEQVKEDHLEVFSAQNCPVLYLLNLQPYPDDEEFNGWDRGLDLNPAGYLAAEQINNRSDILIGRELRLVDIESGACERSIPIRGLVNFYRELLISTNNTCIVGVTGLICSSVTNVLAPIAGHPNIGYIQIASSVSPQHRNNPDLPYLFHILSSSGILNEAVIALMKAFHWQKVGLVHDSLGFYARSTANDFVYRIQQSYPSAKIVTRVPIANSRTIIPEIFNIINNQEVRINYWLVGSHDQSSFGLCEAYKRRFLWPGYIYIMRLLDFKDLLLTSTRTTCSEDEILLALEGIFLIEYRSFVDDNIKLYSGWTYKEYRQRYSEKLWEYAVKRTDHVKEHIWANLFYDQVWAFALAINGSLQSILSKNLSFMDYRIGNTKL